MAADKQTANFAQTPSAADPGFLVSGWRRTTMAFCVGATFQLGEMLGKDPLVRKIECIASGGR